MNAPFPPTLRAPRRHAFPTRPRTELPALKLAPKPAPVCADHDFLVPNPRPDLIGDVALARMLER